MKTISVFQRIDFQFNGETPEHGGTYLLDGVPLVSYSRDSYGGYRLEVRGEKPRYFPTGTGIRKRASDRINFVAGRCAGEPYQQTRYCYLCGKLGPHDGFCFTHAPKEEDAT